MEPKQKRIRPDSNVAGRPMIKRNVSLVVEGPEKPEVDIKTIAISADTEGKKTTVVDVEVPKGELELDTMMALLKLGLDTGRELRGNDEDPLGDIDQERAELILEKNNKKTD